MTPTFSCLQTVRFAHCDPAGIAFYPRLFEILNAAIEDLAGERLGITFAQMHSALRRGLPTGHLEVDFHRPFRLGEAAAVELSPLAVGHASLDLPFIFPVADEVRLGERSVLAWFDLGKGRALARPHDIKKRLLAMVAKTSSQEVGRERA